MSGGSGTSGGFVRSRASTSRRFKACSASTARLPLSVLATARGLSGERFTLSPGAGSRGQYSHEGEEFIHVLSGRFEITLDGRQRYQLNAGDSMYFESTSLHAWVNPGSETTMLLWINTPPTF